MRIWQIAVFAMTAAERTVTSEGVSNIPLARKAHIGEGGRGNLLGGVRGEVDALQGARGR